MPGTRKYPCPCCGYLTLPEEPPGTDRICPVCFWQDDFLQYSHPVRKGGGNGVSLEAAQHNFRSFGYAKERSKDYVRDPHPEEYPPDSD